MLFNSALVFLVEYVQTCSVNYSEMSASAPSLSGLSLCYVFHALSFSL